MANTMNVGDHYPGFNKPDVRMNFENPISMKVSTNAERCELSESFLQLPVLSASNAYGYNTNFEILGTNASNDDVTFSSTVAGIVMETDGAQNDQVIIVPHLTSGQSAWTSIKWGTENQTIWECVLRTGSSITNATIWAGLKLTNTSVIATDNDQAMFRFASADSNTTWRCINSIGGTDVNTDSVVTVAVNTNYYFRIEIDVDRKAHFFINDKEVASSTALTNDVDLIPYVGVQETLLAGGAKHIILCKEKISRILYE